MDLSEAIAQTLSSNPEILAQLREADARNRQVREALGGFYPDVDLLAGIGFQERDPTNQGFINAPGRTRNELERSETQLNVRQMVFDGFNTWNEYQNQKSREESAQHRAIAVAEQISLDAIEAYLEVLKREEIYNLAQSTLAFHQDIFDRMQKRSDSGVGSRADFDQISGRLALANTNLYNARANLINAKTNFQRVVGEYPEPANMTTPTSVSAQLPGSVEEAIAKAVESHPIVQVAMSDINGVQFQYEQTKSPYYPELYVDVERDLNKNIDGIEGQVDDLRVMLRMRYNLYNGGSDQARKQQFAHLVEKAREIRNNAVRQVEQEVRLAWIAREILVDQMPSLQAHVRDSAATKNAYINQFDLGRRTLLDLLNTENENITAQQALISAKYDIVFNEFRIFQSMGQLMPVLGASFQ